MEYVIHFAEAALVGATVWMTVKLLSLYRQQAHTFSEAQAEDREPASLQSVWHASRRTRKPGETRPSRADCMAQIHVIWSSQLVAMRAQDMQPDALYHPGMQKLVSHYLSGIVQAVGEHYGLTAPEIESVEAHALEGCLTRHIQAHQRHQVRLAGSDNECQQFYLAGYQNARHWLDKRHLCEVNALVSCMMDWGLVA
ncbi:MAG: hypothetical protein D6758_03095 [Gammaproteobacteria bacterium]|nr:MAG: hypothetical protein D6758_03095 [Gammaproteobacteria bacterium]